MKEIKKEDEPVNTNGTCTGKIEILVFMLFSNFNLVLLTISAINNCWIRIMPIENILLVF